MIYADYIFKKSGCPKYLDSVACLMERAYLNAFLNRNQFLVFTNLLKSEIKECKQKNSQVHMEIHFGNSKMTEGQISVYTKEYTEDSVLCLSLKPIRGILKYNEIDGDFFDVSEELNDELVDHNN